MDIPTTPPAEDLLSHTLAFCGDCLNREDYTAAWQALCRAVSLAPQRPDILSHRGRLALFLKDSGTAQRDFAEALKLDPRCSAALSGLARCYMQQGDPAAAETAADRALGIDPADEESAGVKAEIQAERRSAQPRQLSSMDSRATPAERGDFVPTVGGGPAPGFNDRDETTEANRSNCAVRLEPLEVPTVGDTYTNGFLSHDLALDPEHLDALKILADWNLGQQRYQEAALTYGKLIGKEPARVELYLSLAKCFFELGDQATAESALEHALHLEPHNQLVRDNLSILREMPARSCQTAMRSSVPTRHSPPVVAESLACSNNAHLLDNQDPMKTQRVIAIRERQPAAIAQPVEAGNPEAALVAAIMRLAEGYFAKKQLAEARDSLSLLDAAAAHTSETLQTMGNLSVLLGQHEAGAAAFGRALALRPDNVPVLVALALMDLQLHQDPNFGDYLNRALALDPENPDALKLLADWSLAHGAYRDAVVTYGKLIDRHPNQVEVFLSIAKCFFGLGDRALTFQSLQHVLQLDPTNAMARDNLVALQSTETPAPGCASSADALPVAAARLLTEADAAYSQGDLAGAGEALNRAVNHAPRSVPLWVCLGNVEFQQNRFIAAFDAYRNACEIDPRNVDALVRLASISLRCENVTAFEENLSRALALDANNAQALCLLADATYSAGQFKEAAVQYERLLDEAPNDPELLLLMANCRYQTGHLPEARDYFERVLDLQPAHASAQANLQVVKQRLAAGQRAGPKSVAEDSLELVS